jgi:LuxR family transcriptional regulator/LuxR family quorum-sensing system transcriptional regulator CciR
MPDRNPIRSLNELICDLSDVSDKVEAYMLLRRYCAGLGAELVSYHRTVQGLRQLKLEDGFEFHSFPDAWVQHYEARKYFEIDPIILASRSVSRPFRWFEVGALMRLTPDQIAFLEDVRAHGILDGYGIPVFSALGTAAYFGVGTRKGVLKLDESQLLELSMACQVTHLRSLELEPKTRGTERDEELTAREKEVLTRVAMGHSNHQIADELGISERTVDGTLRRVFAKLDVTDRVSATVRALSMGTIQI